MSRPARVGEEDFLLFNETLRSAILVGAPLPEGLEVLAREMGRAPVREASAWVAGELRNGSSLSQALAQRPGVFPPVYARLVQAGERAGNLHAVLQGVTAVEREMLRLRSGLKEAMVYPVLLSIFCSLLLLLWGTTLAPQMGRDFSAMFTDMGLDGGLPLATPPALWILLHGPWIGWGAVGITLALILVFWMGSARGLSPFSAGTERVFWRFPVLGGMLRAVAASRFCHTAALLVGRGVPAPEALVLSAEASGSAWVSADAPTAEGLSERGGTFSDSLHAFHALPDVLLWMARHGEGRGELPSALEQLGQLYLDAALRRARLLRMFSPAFFILLVAGIAAGTVLALFLPLIAMMTQMGG
jgi:general secretion pathway protein F